MYNHIYPVFIKGRVLKKESIEYLRDFPYGMASLAYERYTDGILHGFSVRCADGRLSVSGGALKHRGRIILVPEGGQAIEIPEVYGRQLYLALRLYGQYETEDYIVNPVDIVLVETEPELNAVNGGRADGFYEVELGRFRLEKGADLRCGYDSFQDFNTPQNTLDITRVPYAGDGAQTLHPLIMRAYGRALLNGAIDAESAAFAFICLNAGIVQKESILLHIAQQGGSLRGDCALTELYGALAALAPRPAFRETKEDNKIKGRGPRIS